MGKSEQHFFIHFLNTALDVLTNPVVEVTMTKRTVICAASVDALSVEYEWTSRPIIKVTSSISHLTDLCTQESASATMEDSFYTRTFCEILKFHQN